MLACQLTMLNWVTKFFQAIPCLDPSKMRRKEEFKYLEKI